MALLETKLFHVFVLFSSTGNEIGEKGATSVSDALKSNTTLTKLDLTGEHKRNNTQMASINNPPFSNKQTARREKKTQKQRLIFFVFESQRTAHGANGFHGHLSSWFSS